MTHDSDILAKFKLLSDSTIRDNTPSKAQEKRTIDLFDGFMQDFEDGSDDLFGSFLKKLSGKADSKGRQIENLYERIQQEAEQTPGREKEAEHKSKKLNFIQKAIGKLFHKTHLEVSQQAGKFVSLDKDKDSITRKSAFSGISGKYNPEQAYISDKSSLKSGNFAPSPKLEGSLLSKIAKISVNYNTDNMEDIIKSEELTNSELVKLFMNYVSKSVEEHPGSKDLLDKLITESSASTSIDSTSVDRVELENIFINFIKETVKDQYSSPLDKADTASSQVITQFAAAINPEYMTREELEELFVRFCRLLSISDAAAFKSLQDILSSALAIAFVPDDGSAMRNAKFVDSFRLAINPEYMTREELEELFIRFARELSVNAPGAWSEMSGILSNAISVAFSPDISMDDQSRAAIANFRMAIAPERMTRDDLDELFTRFSREVSEKFPSAWAELMQILNNALPSAFVLDTTMDPASRSAIAGFSQAINPESMTREELEELFIRFAREISVKFPAAWVEMQGMLSVAVSNAFAPDITMDPASKAAIAGFTLAINPEYMTRDELEELFVRFSREVSVRFPAAWAELQGMLSVAVSNAFAPDETMDDSSRSAIAGFSQAIKPEFMTRDTLEELFVRFARDISVKFPAAWAELQGMLNLAVAQAFVPDVTWDDDSRAAVSSFELTIKPGAMKREEMEELYIRFVRQVSAQFPAALDVLRNILNQSLNDVYIEPIPDMDNRSINVIASFEAAIKPDAMTANQIADVFSKFVGQISAKFPSADQLIRGILQAAMSNAFIPDETMDPASRSAIAGFAQAIKPEVMTRETLEELFIRFSREVSVRFPAAWAELQGMLSMALGNAFVPDETMDPASRSAIAGFSQAIKPEVMTREDLEELFVRFSREVSIRFPAAWAELQGMLSVAVANAFVPDTTMDPSSRSAIAGFAQAIKPEYMTRDQLEELFIRFSREISIMFPAAWAELQGILSEALPSAFVPDTTMDDSSRSAIAGFYQVIDPEVMTREELEELFVRFAREVSITFPAAWLEMQGLLSVALSNAFVPDTTMDDSSRSAIAGFAQAINPESMTREDLEELFVRFAREVSVTFPAAWVELQGMLGVAVSNAFVPDTTMDDDSRDSIAGFEQTIKPEFMTREELEEIFVRFARKVSIMFPAAWAELQAMLNLAIENAFVPDTTMNDDTRYLIGDFETAINSKEYTEDELNNLFADFMRQVPLKFPVVKSILENTTKAKRGDAESKDKEENKIREDFDIIKRDFEKVTQVSNELNLKAQELSKDLKAASNKEDIKDTQEELRKIQSAKGSLDNSYTASKVDINSNIKANLELPDDYVQNLSMSFDRKDDRQLFEIDTEKLSNWDMLRTLRREEVLDVMYDMPKETLTECLYVIPKHLLKQALVQLPMEDMCRVLFNARFPEALLRSMPRNKAIELLPSAEEMLPILMNMGNISGFKNGCDLLEDVIVNGLKVEPEQNPTRTQEEILPFVMDQLLAKTPRNADARHPVQGKQSPLQRALADIEADPDSLNKQFDDANKKVVQEQDIERLKKTEPDKFEMYTKDKKIDAEQELLKLQIEKDSKKEEKNKLELKYQRPESLNPEQLEKLGQDTVKNLSQKEAQETLGAKRGSPAQMLEFLESLKKVKDLASAKMAVSVLSVAQTKAIAKASLPLLETKHLVKISQYYGKSSKEMVKDMPRYSIEGLIKSLPKHYMIEGFKLLDKSMIIGMMKTQPSQTIARVAAEMLSRDMVKDTAFKKQGFV